MVSILKPQEPSSNDAAQLVRQMQFSASQKPPSRKPIDENFGNYRGDDAIACSECSLTFKSYSDVVTHYEDAHAVSLSTTLDHLGRFHNREEAAGGSIPPPPPLQRMHAGFNGQLDASFDALSPSSKVVHHRGNGPTNNSSSSNGRMEIDAPSKMGLKCYACTDSFYSMEALNLHFSKLQSHLNTLFTADYDLRPGVPARCRVCGVKENCATLIHDHFRKYHAVLPNPFLIRKSPEAFLGNNNNSLDANDHRGGERMIGEWNSELAKHLVKKEEPMQFFCQLCNKKFRRKEELIAHYQHHQQSQVII